MTKPHISLKVFNKEGRMVKHLSSRKSRRILNCVLAQKNQDYVFEVCVSYGKHLDNFGHMVFFDNEGKYTTKKDLINALREFLEK